MGQISEVAEAEGQLELVPEFMSDVDGWRWFLKQSKDKTEERLNAQISSVREAGTVRTGFPDASY